MHAVVDMYPCSMSDTGLAARSAIASRKFFMCARIAGATCCLEILLRLVLRELLELVGHVLVHRRLPLP